MKTATDDSELQFLRIYKDYIYCFNLLEGNIVLCLSHARKEGEFSATVDKYRKYSFNENVKRLKQLMKRNGLYENLYEWFQLLEKCRLMRNKIVHGEWLFRYWLEAPILFDIHFPEKEKGCYTLNKFATELELLNKVIEDFNKFRIQYEIKDTKPNKTLEEMR